MRATRLSRSELLGLHWEDLDIVNKRLKIRRGRVQDCDEARWKMRDRARDQDLPECALKPLLLLRAVTKEERPTPAQMLCVCALRCICFRNRA